MNRPHNLWRSLVPRPNKMSAKSKPAQRKRKQLLIMLKILKDAYPDIYQGKPSATLSKEEAEEFCEQLRLNMPGYIYKQRRNFFILGLERGQDTLKWDVYIPAPITTASREPPFFTHNAMISLNKLRDIERVFLKSLDSPIPENKSVILGYLIFSAAVYGGLLNRHWLIAWIKKPIEGLIYEEPIAWVDLYRDMTGKGQQEYDKTRMLHRRWFLDPLTLLLVCKFKDQITFGSYKRSDPRIHLKSLMDHLNIPNDIRPKSLAGFLSLAHTKIAMYSKTYLADYGSGAIKSASIPADIWARVRTGRPAPISARTPNIEQPYFPIDKTTKQTIHGRGKMTASVRKMLYEAIFPKKSRDKKERISSAQSKNNILKFLDIYGSDLSPIGWLLAQWAVNLLTYKRGVRKGSKMAASSVLSYITTITKPLHIHVLNDNITEYLELEFYEVYRDVIEQKSSEDNKQVTAKRLAEFHDFLVRYWDVPSIQLSEFHRGSYKSDIGVNANLICPTMYNGIITALGGLDADQSRESLALVLMTILGQKCGLRRGEVLTLLCSDICGNYNPMLFVRHNPYAYKKSDNAIRKISLKTFLTHKEIKLLKGWVNQRNTEDFNNKREIELQELYDDEGVLNMGDDSSRPQAVSALCTAENSKRRRMVERTRLLGNPGISRKSLYQLAQTCGHASPEMSLRHYVHILDLLLGCFCWRSSRQPELTLEAVRNLTGIGKAMAYRYRKRSGNKLWIPSIFIPTAIMRFKHELKDVLMDNLKTANTTLVTIEKKPVDWVTVQSILESRQINKMENSDLAQQYSLDSILINSWIEKARSLYKMRTRSTIMHPKGKPRHRLDSDRLPFPTRPQSSYDIDMINRIFKSFRRANKNKAETIQRGVLHFIKYFSLSTANIRFKDKLAAKDYLNFLSLIGIKDDEIQLTHYRGKGIEDSDAKIQFDKWIKYLSIHTSHCKLVKSPHGQSNHDGTIGISISTVTGRTGKGRKNKKPKFSMPYGFRYALYILYIISSET